MDHDLLHLDGLDLVVVRVPGVGVVVVPDPDPGVVILVTGELPVKLQSKMIKKIKLIKSRRIFKKEKIAILRSPNHIHSEQLKQVVDYISSF